MAVPEAPNPFVLSAPPNPSPNFFRQACNEGNLDAIKEHITDQNPNNFALSIGLKHAAATDQVETICYFLGSLMRVSVGTPMYIQSREAWEAFLRHGDQLNPPSLRGELPLM